MTVAVRPAGRTTRRTSRPSPRIVNATQPGRPDLGRRRCAGPTRRIPARAACSPSSTATPVGAATVGRIYMYPPEFAALLGHRSTCCPRRAARASGAPCCVAISDVARGAGKTGLHIPASRGAARRASSSSPIAGSPSTSGPRPSASTSPGSTPPASTPPDGDRAHDARGAARPRRGRPRRRARGVRRHPGGDEPMAAGDLAEFRARDVDRAGDPATTASSIAVDAATDRGRRLRQPAAPVPASTTDRLARHDRGPARLARPRARPMALKRRDDRWAIEHGLTALETGNDDDNAPMRAVNARLGYRPLPDLLTMRGPLVRRHHGRGDRTRRDAEIRRGPGRAAAGSGRVRLGAQRAGPRARACRPPYIAGGDDPDPGRPCARSATTAGCCSAWSWCSIARRVRRRYRRSRCIGSGAMTGAVAAPSGRLDDATWAAAHDALDRDAARPHPDPVGQPARPGRARTASSAAARHIAGLLEAAGLRARGRRARARAAARSTSGCAATGPAASRCCCCRTSTSCRRRPSAGRHDPFAADIADGYVYGRGAVDMKGMVAMELGVVRAAGRRGAGRRPRPGPRPDPGPAPRRPVHLHRGRGGRRPRRRAAGSPSTGPSGCGPPAPSTSAAASSVTVAGRRLYPIQVAEKGFAAVPDRRPRARGATARCRARTTPPSWPRRSSSGWPSPARSAITPVMARFLEPRPRTRSRPRRAARPAALASGDDPAAPTRRSTALCDPMYARAAARAAPRHDQPGRHPRRGQVQRHPRRRHRSRSTAASCPARPSRTMRAEVDARGSGPSSPPACDDRADRSSARRSRRPPRARSTTSSSATLRDHDPDGIPLPVMAPFATDAKHTAPLGVPTYGFSPLRLDARRAVPRAVPRRRRARLARRPALGAARPVRRGPPLLRLTAAAVAQASRSDRRRRSPDDGPARRRSCRRRAVPPAQSRSGSCSAAS